MWELRPGKVVRMNIPHQLTGEASPTQGERTKVVPWLLA
jgi:hypothetical protein